MNGGKLVFLIALASLAVQGCGLTLHAVGTPVLARDGNREPAAVVLAVNGINGPVEGLDEGNFQVVAGPVGAGGCLVEISRVLNNFPGRYVIELVPIASNAACVWRTGRYGIAVHAQSGSRQGTGVAAIDIAEDAQIAGCSQTVCEDAIDIKSSSQPVGAGLAGVTTMSCDQGYAALAGGYAFDNPNDANPRFRISRSAPATGQNGRKQWWIKFANIGTSSATLSTYVICVKTT